MKDLLRLAEFSRGVHRSSFLDFPLIDPIVEKGLLQIRGLFAFETARDLKIFGRFLRQFLERPISQIELDNFLADVKKRVDSYNERNDETICNVAREIYKSYFDSRFYPELQLFLKVFFISMVGIKLDDAIKSYHPTDEMKGVNILRCCGGVYYDLDLLKAINLVFGDTCGDIYLKDVARILTTDPEIIQFAKDNNFSFVTSSLGGDEFFHFVVSNEPLDDAHELLTNLAKLAKRKIKEMRLDYTNFDDPLVQEAIKEAGLYEKYLEVKNGSAGPVLLKPSAGYGCVGMLEALETTIVEDRERIMGDNRYKDKYIAILNRTIRYVIDYAAGRCKLHKKAELKKKEASSDPVDNFFLILTKRTREAMKQAEEMINLRRAARNFFDLLKVNGAYQGHTNFEEWFKEKYPSK